PIRTHWPFQSGNLELSCDQALVLAAHSTATNVIDTIVARSAMASSLMIASAAGRRDETPTVGSGFVLKATPPDGSRGRGRKDSIKLQPPSDRVISWNVDLFLGRFQLPNSDPRQKLALRRNKLCHVDDLKQLTLAEVFQHRAPQTELDRAPRNRVAMRIVIWIPLQAHVRALERRLPFVLACVVRLVP